MVVAERVFDLVGHRQLGGAQHARLPQLRDACADQLFVATRFTLAAQVVALADEFGNRAFGIENALALHLGGVRGEHGRDIGLAQGGGNVGGMQVGAVQALEAQFQRAFLLVAFALVVRTPTHMVAVFGDVGQVREVAEGTDHAHRLLGGQVLQQAVEGAPGAGIALQPVAHRQLAHAFDQLEGVLAFLFADDLAEDAAEKTDVLDQRAILRCGVARRLGTCGTRGRCPVRRGAGLGRHEGSRGCGHVNNRVVTGAVGAASGAA